MTSSSEIVAKLEEIGQKISRIMDQIRVSGQQVIVTSLSEVSEQLGLIRAGEFRSGNNREPGDGFTGVRIAYPPINKDGKDWNITVEEDDRLVIGLSGDETEFRLGNGNELGEGFSGLRMVYPAQEWPVGSGNWHNLMGANQDEPMFWISSVDGAGSFASGRGRIDDEAVKLDGLLYGIQHTMTVGSVERMVRMGGYLLNEVDTVPNWTIEYGQPSVFDVGVINPGFETGDLTGWTVSSNLLEASGISPRTGVYCARGSMYGEAGYTYSFIIESTDFITVQDDTNYRLSFYTWMRNVNSRDLTAQILWYDSGGTYISTGSTSTTGGSLSYSQAIVKKTSPSTAAKAKIRITLSPSITGSNKTFSVHLDDITFEDIDNSIALNFTDAGIQSSKGLYPSQWWGGFDAFRAFTSNGLVELDLVYNAEPTQWGDYVAALSARDAAANNYYTLYIPLDVGEYTFRMCYRRSTDRGIVKLYVDGADWTSGGGHDMYGSALSNQFWEVQSIIIPQHGVHEFKITVPNKNASSSDYRVAASFVCIKKSG